MVKLLCDGVLCHGRWWLTTLFCTCVSDLEEASLQLFVDHKLGVGAFVLTLSLDSVAAYPVF